MMFAVKLQYVGLLLSTYLLLVWPSTSALDPKWRAFIAPEILSQYAEKDQSRRFSISMFEGDMSINTDNSNVHDIQSQFRNVFTDNTTRWPAGLIHYSISNKFTTKEKTIIEDTLKTTSAATANCIRFVPRTLETDYLSFIRGFACFSGIGFQTGSQLISLKDGCLENVGVIQHVLMHALGFYHENNRMDRDGFITLNEANILPAARKKYFRKYIDLMADGDFPYDIESITHYPFNVFAIEPTLPTIIPNKRSSPIGKTNGLSKIDVMKIRLAYGCENPQTTTPADQPFLTPDTADISVDDQALLALTPDPPDDLTTTPTPQQRRVQPVFRMDPITPAQCLALNTDNCRISSASKNCTAGYGYIATCSADASNIEIEYFFTKIQQRNASRGLEITVRGVREFANHTFAPVADILIILIVADYPGFSMSHLRALELPIITHIGLANCSQVVVKQDDLLFFPRLTMFVMAKSTVNVIEAGAFDSLKGLQQVALDAGYKTDKSLPKDVIDHLRLLHCDCRYDWLRAFLRKLPYLIAPRKVGEVHRFGGILSHAFTLRETYIPVDCAKPGLVGDASQTEFAINTNCPSEMVGRRSKSLLSRT